MKTTPKKAPQSVAARIFSSHLDPNEIYGRIMDEVSEDEFVAMENKIMGDGIVDLRTTTEVEQREIARQEACFLLGLEIGKRIGGAR